LHPSDRTLPDATARHRGWRPDKAPRIIAVEENRLNIGQGNIAYVSGFGDADTPGQVYRAGTRLVDPDSQRTLGFEAVFLVTRG
jgi:hypothetical protein